MNGVDIQYCGAPAAPPIPIWQAPPGPQPAPLPPDPLPLPPAPAGPPPPGRHGGQLLEVQGRRSRLSVQLVWVSQQKSTIAEACCAAMKVMSAHQTTVSIVRQL